MTCFCGNGLYSKTPNQERTNQNAWNNPKTILSYNNNNNNNNNNKNNDNDNDDNNNNNNSNLKNFKLYQYSKIFTQF